MSANRKTLLAVTLGDVRGIGPEIIEKAAASREVRDAADLVFVGPSGAGIDVDRTDGLVDAWRFAPPTRAASQGVRSSGRWRSRLQGEVDGIVTAPIDKAALLAGGYRSPATPR